MKQQARIAYFSMEIAVDEVMPTYAGGLGVLAGDTLRSAADMNLPMIAMTLLPRWGYLHQSFDENGRQIEDPVNWAVNDYLRELPQTVIVEIEGRSVVIRAWEYMLAGAGNGSIPVYFLDTDLEQNSKFDRTITHYLYGGDSYYRLCQELVLGVGGVRMLRALGYDALQRYHLNEGHASLLILELLNERLQQNHRSEVNKEDTDAVRKLCVFTTHTPVAAGHDQFPLELVYRVLGSPNPLIGCEEHFCFDSKLNMTYLALANCHYINGVAKKHSQIARQMFAGYPIDSITNGVHAKTWICPHLQALFDEHIPGWHSDSASLRYALNISKTLIWHAHQAAKLELLKHVNEVTHAGMDNDVFTIGFARRATAYKRPDLLLTDIERLNTIAAQFINLQIIYAGKAHPRDNQGKALIERIYHIAGQLGEHIKLVYLPDYDIRLGKLMTAGCDIWLNTPLPPLEASGTSGMKAALNGVPSLSTLDGWWLEGCIEGLTGWAIGDGNGKRDEQAQRIYDSHSLYDKLEHVILPLYYRDQEGFINVMRHTIALNGSFFNTERMLNQYVAKAYY